MEITITDEEWNVLAPENFDTTALLRAVDAVDELRGDLNGGEDGGLPQLRIDLLKLLDILPALKDGDSYGAAR